MTNHILGLILFFSALGLLLIQLSANMRDINVAAMLPALILIVAADFSRSYIKH